MNRVFPPAARPLNKQLELRRSPASRPRPSETLRFGVVVGISPAAHRAREHLDVRGAKVVIAQHPRRIPPLVVDREMYKWRHLIENFFCKHKEFKRIAMRADKTDRASTP